MLRGRNKLPPSGRASSWQPWGRYQTQASLLSSPSTAGSSSSNRAAKWGYNTSITHFFVLSHIAGSFRWWFIVELNWCLYLSFGVCFYLLIDECKGHPLRIIRKFQGHFETSWNKCIAFLLSLFCWYYLRTKINVLRKVCREVKGINWKVKAGEVHDVTFPTNHCCKISHERTLSMHPPRFWQKIQDQKLCPDYDLMNHTLCESQLKIKSCYLDFTK